MLGPVTESLALNGDYVLLSLVLLGVLGRNNLVAASGCILLALRLTGLDRYAYPWLEREGIATGLLFLLLYALVPYARGAAGLRELRPVLTSRRGLLVMAAGAVASRLNAQGLDLLRSRPDTVVGMTLGAVLGVLFLDGVPCGPLMAAAVTAVFVEVGRWLGLS